MKILLVEPDRVLAKVLTDSLHAAGHDVVCARTAQTSLDGADDSPDIIVLETQLGLHNGIEFLYELRSYVEWQDIPVIIHTLNTNLLNEQFAKPLTDLGVVKTLYKPQTTTKQLIDILETVPVI